MSKTERRYTQIEKEALATTWALEHWAELLVGMTFKVETDHKPLVPFLSTKLIDELPLRIQRFRMRLMRYITSPLITYRVNICILLTPFPVYQSTHP